jgi:hypothetical protein
VIAARQVRPRGNFRAIEHKWIDWLSAGGIQSPENRQRIKTLLMNDLIFVGTVIAFFVVSALYVRFCDKL